MRPVYASLSPCYLVHVGLRWLIAALLLSPSDLLAQRILTADGRTEAYALVRSVLGASAETPDCAHPEFGPHITQADDSELGKPAFVFHSHVTPDNDRCTAFDRQRIEIKTDGGSPAYLKGFLGDSVTFRWKFRLPEGFQPSSSFTHIHQLKAGDGDADMPTITLTPRKGTPNRLQVIWSDGEGGHTSTVTEVPLAPLLGAWVEALEKVTYSHQGSYSITIRRIRDGAILLSYTNNNMDLWRSRTTFTRPKWGIYRSLNNQADLRDEQVRFDRFCVAKGGDECPGDEPSPAFTVSAAPPALTVAAGGTAGCAVTITPSGNFTGNVRLGVTGLPSGASASFTPASVTASGSSAMSISTSSATPPGTYALIVGAGDGGTTRTTLVEITVTRSGATPPNIRGVANAASLLPGLSPEAWFTISGTNLAPAARAWRPDEITGGRLPIQLDGVSVTVDGKPAALSYISPAQLNVQMPSDILPGPPVLVQVTTPQGASSAAITLQPFAPALFALEAMSRRYVAAQHGRDYSIVARSGLYEGSSPARPGEVIVIYGTGFGPTYPTVPSGQAVTRAAPLANSTTVWIGGEQAELLWAGLVAPGLHQLNVRVPPGLSDGDLPVVAEIAGSRTEDGLFLTVLR